MGAPVQLEVLFAATPDCRERFREPLARALADAGVAARVSPETPQRLVDCIVYAPDSGLEDFSVFPRLRAVQSLWAGVEAVVGNRTLTAPLARMVDSGLERGMVEWVVGHALRHHLGLDKHVLKQDGSWEPSSPPLASDRPVTVLGLGALGAACARALADLGFPVSGWSREPRDIPGIRCHSGPEGLDAALAGAEIVALLLPNTPATANTLDARTMALLAPGAFVLNPGRGSLIDDDALLAALDSGAVGHATLDVFRTEPLPSVHPYWTHPRVTVTPHVAAATRPESASRVVAENLRRVQAGESMLHLVERDRGY